MIIYVHTHTHIIYIYIRADAHVISPLWLIRYMYKKRTCKTRSCGEITTRERRCTVDVQKRKIANKISLWDYNTIASLYGTCHTCACTRHPKMPTQILKIFFQFMYCIIYTGTSQLCTYVHIHASHSSLWRRVKRVCVCLIHVHATKADVSTCSQMSSKHSYKAQKKTARNQLGYGMDGWWPLERKKEIPHERPGAWKWNFVEMQRQMYMDERLEGGVVQQTSRALGVKTRFFCCVS